MSDEEKRTGTLLIAVDTSCEMTYGEIEAVDEAINDAVQEIRTISIIHDYVRFKINVLGFSGESAAWLTSKPVNVNDFKCNLADKYNDKNCDSYSKFSVACKELIDRLSDDAFMGDSANAFIPIIIMVVSHKFDENYRERLKEFKTKRALKYLIVVGGDIDVNALNEFKSDMEIFEPIYGFGYLRYIVRGILAWAACKFWK